LLTLHAIVPAEHSLLFPVETPMGTGRLNQGVGSIFCCDGRPLPASALLDAKASIFPVTIARTETPSRSAGIPGTLASSSSTSMAG